MDVALGVHVVSVFFSQEGWNSGNEESELVYKLFRGRIQPSYNPVTK